MSDNTDKVAVIIAVYDGDDTFFFNKAIQSIFNQTYPNIDVYLYVDAVHKPEIKDLITKFQQRENFYTVNGQVKKGLAYGLNCLLENIKDKGYGFIARMDSDDISVSDRLEKQINFLNNNTRVSVIGSNCIEISNDGKEIFHKKMPESHQDILDIVIKRSPFIHPSVMFRGDVIEHIKYNNQLMNTQDYYLWVDLLAKGLIFYNIQEPLLYFRVNDSFYSRRGLSKVFNELKSRIYAINKLKRHSAQSYIYLIGLVMLRLAPVSVKKFCYMRFR